MNLEKLKKELEENPSISLHLKKAEVIKKISSNEDIDQKVRTTIESKKLSTTKLIVQQFYKPISKF